MRAAAGVRGAAGSVGDDHPKVIERLVSYVLPWQCLPPGPPTDAAGVGPSGIWLDP
jgi:hypothetical protein